MGIRIPTFTSTPRLRPVRGEASERGPPVALYVAWSVNAKMSRVPDSSGQAWSGYNRSPEICAERGQIPTIAGTRGKHGRAVRQGTQLGVATGWQISAR